MTAWARSSLHLIIFAWVYCGSKPSFFSMGPHNFSLTRLPAIIDFYWWIHTETTGDYFGICFPFFQGQKPGLTDVQAELDRMTRKQDSMVSANNVPPPTQNEAWRQRKRLHRPLHWYSGTVHVHLSRKKLTKIPTSQSSHTVVSPKSFSYAFKYFGVLVRRGCVEVLMR